MSDRRTISVTINGETFERNVETRLTLADFIRHECLLTGTHVGCEHGVCGACTILLNGQTARSCLMLAVQADGSDVVTIEGLSDSGEVADLQAEFEARNAAQCGYCTPGMVITSAELIAAGGTPDREAIRDHLSGNLCRCTGYQAIVDAVEKTMKKRAEA